jgi:ABC-type antimicrobial peptide transport system permease subunit
MTLAFVLEATFRLIAGVKLSYAFPNGVALLLFPAVLMTAAVAAIVPARAAFRVSLVEALEYE